MTTPKSGFAPTDAPAELTRALRQKKRTRSRLLDAARIVFSRDGFYESRLADISTQSATSIGTFYNHFESKEDIFRALMTDVLAELGRPNSSTTPEWNSRTSSPEDSIRRANRKYLIGYRRNAQLMKICTFLADGDPEIREIKNEIDNIFESKLIQAIKTWQEEGIATADIDATYAANSLGYMVDRFCYEFYISRKSYDEDKAVDVLTQIWVNALGIDPGSPTN